jgi:hypothetical protein
MSYQKIFSALLFVLGFSAFLGACKKDDPTGDAGLTAAQPVYTEIRDIDGDGEPELIIAFDRQDILRLEKDEVILEGRFSDTDTYFETDGFQVQR